MFLFHPKHFLKFLVQSHPQLSYKEGSYIKNRVYPLAPGQYPLLNGLHPGASVVLSSVIVRVSQ